MSKEELIASTGKATPPIAVSAGSIAGIPLPDLVLWATLIYTVLQIAYLVRKHLRMRTSSPTSIPDCTTCTDGDRGV